MGRPGRSIEAKAAAQAEAAKPTETSYAQIAVLTMQRRTPADALQVELAHYERDMKNLGMTEAQMHEIIPDVPSSAGCAQATAAKPTAPAPS